MQENFPFFFLHILKSLKHATLLLYRYKKTNLKPLELVLMNNSLGFVLLPAVFCSQFIIHKDGKNGHTIHLIPCIVAY